MDLELNGKVALVTGASRGIGAAIAEALAREGCDVTLTARTREGLASTADRAKRHGPRALVHVSNLREPEAPARFASAALLSLAKALAARGVVEGARVNVVNPGAVRTDRFATRVRALAEQLEVSEEVAAQKQVERLGSMRLGLPEDIAQTVAFLAGPRAGCLHGAMIDVDGGQTKTL